MSEDRQTPPAWSADPAPPVLQDGVVRLRPLREEDRDRVLAAVRDPEMVRWTTIPDPYPDSAFDEWLAEAASGWSQGSGAVWAMADPGDDSYLGGIDVRLDGEAGAEVGYAVAPWARGRGVGSHAVALACRWAFDVARVEVVLWLAYAGNEASRRTARRVGFRVPESVVRRGLAQRGHRRDAWVGDLLPEDLRDLS